MKVALVATLLAGTAAQAQGAGSEPSLVLVLGPPALVTLALDVVLLQSLITEGTVPRGRAISAMAFATLTTAFSAICLALGLSSPRSSTAWNVTSASALAVGVGSMVLGIWGSAHPEQEPERIPLPPAAPRRREVLPPEIPPQLHGFPVFTRS